MTSITKLSKDKEMVTAEMQKQLESAQLQLENSLEQLHIKTGELETVKMELSSQANNLEKRLTKDVEGEKERASQQLHDLQVILQLVRLLIVGGKSPFFLPSGNMTRRGGRRSPSTPRWCSSWRTEWQALMCR